MRRIKHRVAGLDPEFGVASNVASTVVFKRTRGSTDLLAINTLQLIAAGLVLIPVVLLKLSTTSYRFIRYYLSTPAYRRAGPPHPILRIDGPFVVVLTIAVLASGVALAIVGRVHQDVYAIHKLSFIAWFVAMTVHVLGHVVSLPVVAGRDWRPPSRIAGSRMRRRVTVGVVIAGLALAAVAYPALPAWGHG